MGGETFQPRSDVTVLPWDQLSTNLEKTFRIASLDPET